MSQLNSLSTKLAGVRIVLVEPAGECGRDRAGNLENLGLQQLER